MSRDDIIRMAWKAGARDYGTGEEGVTALMLRDDAIERFAALVSAAEREACADLCEDTQQEYEQYTGQPLALNYTCATAIRARGQK